MGLFAIAGGKVTRKGSVDVGAFPEGVASSGNGRIIYAGNFHSKTISVLRIKPDGRLFDTHADIGSASVALRRSSMRRMVPCRSYLGFARKPAA